MTRRSKGGWFGESRRHSLASRGVETAVRQKRPRRVRKLKQVHYAEEPDMGMIFGDAHSGETLIFLRVERHPVTGEVTNLIFLDQDGEEVAYRYWGEVIPLSASANMTAIGNKIIGIRKGINDYREDPIMFTYARLDGEIGELERSLDVGGPGVKWALDSDDRERAQEIVKHLRRELEGSEAPWTNED